MRFYPALMLAAIAVALPACSNLEFPGIYQLQIEQGNIIKQEMIDQLKPGMSRSQVEYVMGTALIKDTFNGERWDYVYTLKRSGKKPKQQHLTIFFDGDAMTHFTGDFAATPTAVQDQPEPAQETVTDTL